ncbi:MAG: hypothetical protein M1308_23570 [Actinobacteria bacterium]|nr:hypothetical protein [Actinomycetota bacterium]
MKVYEFAERRLVFGSMHLCVGEATIAKFVSPLKFPISYEKNLYPDLKRIFNLFFPNYFLISTFIISA